MWFPKRPVRSGSRAGPSDVFAAHSALDQPGVFALHGPFYRQQLLKPRRVRHSVPDGVLNVAVTEVILYEPRIRPMIGKSEPASMPEHVGT